MKTLFVFCLLLISFATAAQRRTKMYGSWQSTGYCITHCNDSLIAGYISDYHHEPWVPFILTIGKKKGNFYYIPQTGVLKNFDYEENNVRIKKRKLILKKRKTIDSTRLSKYNDFSDNDMPPIIYTYKLTSDTELILIRKTFDYELQTNCISEFKLKKIATQNYPTISTLNNNYKTKVNEVLKTKLFLASVDSLNKKNASLKVGGEFYIEVETLNKKNFIYNEAEYYLDAIGKSSTDSTILIHCIHEESKYTGTDGYRYNKQKWDDKYSPDSKMTEINISKISFISYTGAIENKVHNTAKTLGWLSLASAIVVAPLVSINYSHLDFNKKRYFNTAGISLGLVTVSLTIVNITNGQAIPYWKEVWT